MLWPGGREGKCDQILGDRGRKEVSKEKSLGLSVSECLCRRRAEKVGREGQRPAQAPGCDFRALLTVAQWGSEAVLAPLSFTGAQLNLECKIFMSQPGCHNVTEMLLR